MKSVLLVAAGGALGSVSRFLVYSGVSYLSSAWRFPAGTFVVNVVGCLIAGVLAGWVARTDTLSADLKLLLFTGFLGGFTTFSAFTLETFQLLRRGETAVALANAAFSVAIGLAALAAGFWLTGPRNS